MTKASTEGIVQKILVSDLDIYAAARVVYTMAIVDGATDHEAVGAVVGLVLARESVGGEAT